MNEQRQNMKYGKNTQYVEEVQAYIEETGIFHPGFDDTKDWLIVQDLEEAKEFAWDVPDEGYSWVAIREWVVSKLKKPTYYDKELKQVRKTLFDDWYETQGPLIMQQLNEKHRKLYDDISADLYNSAFNRLINGPRGFFEQLFDAYRTGGWPCGWQGELYWEGGVNAKPERLDIEWSEKTENGRFVVYIPRSDV